MKTRKSINYAYPTSPAAERLGAGKSGCFYLAVSVQREDGNWSPSTTAHNAEPYAKADDAVLISEFIEADGDFCPYFLSHGNADALRAISLASI